MTSAKTNTDRRGFLASLAAGASVAAVAVIPKAIAAPLDDSALVKLEEEIFEQYEGAKAFDDEILRLSAIWTDESNRLYDESLSSDTPLTPQQRWALITDMPECKEHNRLCKLQDPFYRRMDAPLKQMWANPGTHARRPTRQGDGIARLAMTGEEGTRKRTGPNRWRVAS